ncbi:beta-galactosidase [Nakamurella sp. UYEF19]|uniref:beta-galactosidase n=1 Tax=Nakamurella sp. UYEF19 TaxID=1756392 RepID=UPI00339894B7
MAKVTERLGGALAFGGDYNPEQWPESVWPEDVSLMQEAGVNLVSVGIFSWALLEPAPGQYDFGWLDRILDLLHAGGIAVDLANASATPPPWLSHRHPESMLVDVDGVTRNYGGRQAFCPSSAAYRDAAAALTTAIVDRYAAHPAVVMWHVHNEYGNHNWSCYCQVSAEAFRKWLQRRYSTLDELNSAWGTTFWSQHYYDWAEVLPPRTPAYQTFANPTQQLDFSRFSSDELLDCYRAEAQIVRDRSGLPVTTNFMQFWKPMDYWRWSQEMDLISNDHYRFAALGPDGATHDLAMAADLVRSLADDAPWLLMEHSTSAVNWQPRNPAKAPGQMRRDSLSHVARGADGALFFQWRASRAGAEKYHSAMLPHAGTDSRRWREVCDLGADIAALADVAGSRTRSRIAIAFDWHSWWGVELDSHPSVDVDQMERVRRWHRLLWQNGYTCDFVHPDRDLSRYQVVLVPALYLCTDDAAANLASFAENGGTVVVGYFSGIVDVDDHIRLGGYPGAFTDLLGIRTEEFSPMLAGDVVPLTVSPDLDYGPPESGEGDPPVGSTWSELIGRVEPDVEVLVSFAGGQWAGEPAVTRRVLAAGRGSVPGSAWYVGTELGTDLLAGLLVKACAAAGVQPVLDMESWPAGFDAVVREDEHTSYLFAFNHGSEAVPLVCEGTDLLTGKPWDTGTSLPPGQVAVVATPLVAAP